MNSREISEILGNDIHARRIFRGVFARNKLPDIVHHNKGRPSSFVINTDPHYKPGSHWVGVFFNGKGHCDYFDSFSFPPLHDDISRFIAKNSFTWSSNKRLMQPLDTATCGLYVIYFIIMRSRGHSVTRAMTYFHPRHFRTNDRAVLRFVQRLQQKNQSKLSLGRFSYSFDSSNSVKK